MKLAQLIKYTNADCLEATWVRDDNPEIIVKCRAYSNDQMNELREDLGEQDSQTYADLISEVEATYVPREPTPLKERQALVWEKIKAEREHRKTLGVKAGDHWFHSDTDSRVQWLGLKDTARDMILAGDENTALIFINEEPVAWKTLNGTFVPVTIQLALDVTEATKILDAKVFKVAEVHRIMMESMSDPDNYDYSTGWPSTIDDEVTVEEEVTE